MKAPPEDPKDKGPDRDSETWSGGRIFDRSWLEGRSPDELVNIILQLKHRVPAKPTDQLDLLASSISLDASAFGVGPKDRVKRYVRLPATRSALRKDRSDIVWRLILISSNSTHKPLGIEIHGDVIVGREASGITPDLDLNDFDGEEYGVSRRHAILRPTQTHLFLIDLGSTNGSYHNGFRLSTGKAQELSDNDFISFGKLHFTIGLVRKPSGPESRTIHDNGKLKQLNSG